ncbi:DUF2607 family protein [Thiomicrorhabdus cannonii]|uniref:DUF2607 family protein n=1 Tax=Thiomicrorhabdus cannonii TaxID=2748011 RepID=UPI0015BDF6E5|nr:DUF2607 family protein [Thiomicrorhabdus cannonii]
MRVRFLKNRIFLAVFLLALFVSAQTASLLHAEIHPFHHHTAECDLLEQIAQPVQAASDAVAPLVTQWRAHIAVTVAVAAPALAVVVPYYGRAPPFSV